MVVESHVELLESSQEHCHHYHQMCAPLKKWKRELSNETRMKYSSPGMAGAAT